jgi:hypothetical protein
MEKHDEGAVGGAKHETGRKAPQGEGRCRDPAPLTLSFVGSETFTRSNPPRPVTRLSVIAFPVA